MRFVTYQGSGSPVARVGVVAADDRSVDQVGDVSALGYGSMLDFLEGGEQAIEKMKAAQLQTVPLTSVKLLAPIPKPRKLICVGLNYRDHAEETGSEIPAVATIFNKFATSVIGAGEAIVLPKVSTKPDYEAEFAFVIGKGGRHIPESAWEDHVFGYTIVNDVSARDYQRSTTQWLMGKTFDTFAPMGPWIVTKDEIRDPHDIDVRMVINGEVLQNGNTRNLIFKIPYLISYLSSVFTLEPGDIVSTGTPAGVGAARTPPRWLKPGDDVVVQIPPIGELRNPVIAEAA
jgi:2-keto-4-pentenoate hydratase/2-oxohepta-3-ene-1,7-dioic acid hydratase in catechol pathway